MGQSESLRNRIEQHKPKNKKSKIDDKDIYIAMNRVACYIEERFELSQPLGGRKYEIIFDKKISTEYMINFIKEKNKRYEFDEKYMKNTIKPDGGVLYLVEKDITGKTIMMKPILISEIKRQGTNDERLKEGKEKQATGNAIERLGKNLTGIKAMMNYEKITPFVCFGWGCDFAEDSTTVLAKVSMLNEFYPLNRINVFKRDGGSDFNYFSPVSMFFREKKWTVDEMYDIMKEIAESAFRYYVM